MAYIKLCVYLKALLILNSSERSFLTYKDQHLFFFLFFLFFFQGNPWTGINPPPLTQSIDHALSFNYMYGSINFFYIIGTFGLIDYKREKKRRNYHFSYAFRLKKKRKWRHFFLISFSYAWRNYLWRDFQVKPTLLKSILYLNLFSFNPNTLIFF